MLQGVSLWAFGNLCDFKKSLHLENCASGRRSVDATHMKAGIYLDSNLAGWDSAFLRFFNSPSTSGGKRFVGCPKQRRLAPARRHFLQRLDLTIPHQQRTIEIVDRGANVPGQEIKRFLER